MAGETYTLVVNGSAINTGGGTSYSFAGACGTGYTMYVVGTVNGRQGGTSSQTATTQACPSQPTNPPTTPTNPTSPTTPTNPTNPSTPTSSSGSGTKKVTTAKPKTATVVQQTAPILGPSTPGNFSASVVSTKVVQLSWDTSSNTDHYVVNRSTDNASWQQLATTKDTSYNDATADFSTVYYYQLMAVGGDGQTSATVTAQAQTEAFTASSNAITSRDKLVTLTIPNGAIDGDYNCTLSTDDSSSSTKASDGQNVVLGPYNVLCITADGTVVDSFNKSIPVTMKLTSASQGYKNLGVRTSGSKGWVTTKSQYNANKRQLSFNLTSSKSFAAFGQKPRSIWGTIFLIFFLLLLAAGGVFGFLFWRRRQTDTAYPPVAASTLPTSEATIITPEPTAQEEFREAVAKPDCSHLSQAQQVVPSSAGCLECTQQGTNWNSLRICLICGHVGCSDDSEQQHALKHFQETGHPLIYEYGNPAGNTIGWCYIDQTYI